MTATIGRIGARRRRPYVPGVRATVLGLILSAAMAMTPSCVLVAERAGAVELTLSVPTASGLSADGRPLTVDALELGVADAWLEPCAARASRSLIGRAYALHPDAGGHSLGGPRVVSLVDGEPIGALSPPPGRWCALLVAVAPHDALDGWTLHAEGDLDGRRFDGEGYAMQVWRLPLAAPLELSEGAPPVALEVAVDLPRALADVPARPVDDVAQALLLALEPAARVRALGE